MKTKLRAFTLIELMIVIAVIGIMSTAVVLTLNGSQRGSQETQSASRQLAAAIREAQNNALGGVQFIGVDVCGYGVKVTATGQLLRYHLNACTPTNEIGAADKTEQLQSVTVTYSGLAAGTEGYVFFNIPFGKLSTNADWISSVSNFEFASTRDPSTIASVCVEENLIRESIGSATTCGAS